MHFARHAAANALIDGWKSVELCQAYILLSTYGVPARRWEEDRGWLYIGLAIRFVKSRGALDVRANHATLSGLPRILICICRNRGKRLTRNRSGKH